jgi:hypothetical protein
VVYDVVVTTVDIVLVKVGPSTVCVTLSGGEAVLVIVAASGARFSM